MSGKVASQAIAFGKVLQAYYRCKINPRNGEGGYGTLGNSVNHITGKVKVCPQDMIADVELAGKRALNGLVNEQHLFRRIYLEADTDFAVVVEKHLGSESFSEMIEQIEKRVGQEFINSHIFPLNDYRREVDTR